VFIVDNSIYLKSTISLLRVFLPELNEEDMPIILARYHYIQL